MLINQPITYLLLRVFRISNKRESDDKTMQLYRMYVFSESAMLHHLSFKHPQ